ncbi:hypothetical protein EJ04DRAFT_553197 [Polyplosphaeria fusca]|uniref:Uncharacterized protein n=1 Tax=Polyplosphaeria fusca TaxID=682080 RepID=A0A9P4V1W3_9PLEO|nr:hypothetical protein EJ04DRAFT_553197 [Polyplosphaeria fusca]
MPAFSLFGNEKVYVRRRHDRSDRTAGSRINMNLSGPLRPGMVWNQPEEPSSDESKEKEHRRSKNKHSKRPEKSSSKESEEKERDRSKGKHSKRPKELSSGESEEKARGRSKGKEVREPILLPAPTPKKHKGDVLGCFDLARVHDYSWATVRFPSWEKSAPPGKQDVKGVCIVRDPEYAMGRWLKRESEDEGGDVKFWV